jgi:hypothetical protein
VNGQSYGGEHRSRCYSGQVLEVDWDLLASVRSLVDVGTEPSVTAQGQVTSLIIPTFELDATIRGIWTRLNPGKTAVPPHLAVMARTSRRTSPWERTCRSRTCVASPHAFHGACLCAGRRRRSGS